MSIAQPQQCQVIDIRNKDTKVHVNSNECIILTREKCYSDTTDESLYCDNLTIGDNNLYIGDIILAQDINLKKILPFKIDHIKQYNFTKDLRQIYLYSFKENPTKLFVAPMAGNIAYKIMESPLFQSVFAYYPGIESSKYRYAIHFLFIYTKQIRDSKQFTLLKELVDNQLHENEFKFTKPFNNTNYLLLTINCKSYWQEDYALCMRGQYSLLSSNYLNYIKTYTSKQDYAFITAVVNKEDSLIQIWQEKLNMTLPPTAELYEAFDLEGKDGLYEHNLISKEDYERIKRLAGYMV